MAEYGRMTGPGPPCVTLQDVIGRYRIHVLPGKAKRTQDEQARQLTRLGKVFGAMRPDYITVPHVYQYMDARSHFPTAARHEVSLLGHIFVNAIRWGGGYEESRTRHREAVQ